MMVFFYLIERLGVGMCERYTEDGGGPRYQHFCTLTIYGIMRYCDGISAWGYILYHSEG